VVEFQLGIALKPSRLGSSIDEKRESLLRFIDLAYGVGVDCLVVDSERSLDDLRPSDVAEAVRRSESIGGPLVVPTVPVRRNDFENLFQEYLEELQGLEAAGLCLVAGNPAYLSSEEASRRPGSLLRFACREAKRVLGDRPLLLGTENVEAVSRRICREVGCTPFLLLDVGVEDEACGFSSVSGGGVAVYAPFYIGVGVPEEASRVLISYARRRRRLMAIEGGHIGLTSALRVSLVGDVPELAERIRRLGSSGVQLLVGFPAEASAGQVRSLALAARWDGEKG